MNQEPMCFVCGEPAEYTVFGVGDWCDAHGPQARDAHSTEDEMSTETTQHAERHTPGPWTLDEEPETDDAASRGYRIYGPHGESVIAEIFPRPYLVTVNVANARLIAAAPELLSELEAAMSDVDCYCQHGQGLCNAHEVIAKARGT